MPTDRPMRHRDSQKGDITIQITLAIYILKNYNQGIIRYPAYK